MIHQVLYKSVCRLAMMAALMLTVTTTALAQITSVHGTVSDDMGPLMAAVVCEIDNNGRIIESAVTDMNGNFTMRVRDAKKNKIQFQYVGLKTLVLPINKTTYIVKMESEMVLDVVEVKAQRKLGGNNLAIPEREISFATQTLDMSEWVLHRSMRCCKDVLPVSISWLTPVTWVPVLPCVCVVLLRSLH